VAGWAGVQVSVRIRSLIVTLYSVVPSLVATSV
jgi:hypothetical protein